VQQIGNPTFSLVPNPGGCDAATIDEVPVPEPADNLPVYRWDGSQYHYNWSTKGLTGGYRIFANLADGTNRYVDVCLTR